MRNFSIVHVYAQTETEHFVYEPAKGGGIFGDIELGLN